MFFCTSEYVECHGEHWIDNNIVKCGASSEFVSSSIPSWQILTEHAQPFRGARDLAFCLKVPLDSLLVWTSSGGSGETARMRRLAWTFAARNGDKYQIRLTRPKLYPYIKDYVENITITGSNFTDLSKNVFGPCRSESKLVLDSWNTWTCQTTVYAQSMAKSSIVCRIWRHWFLRIAVGNLVNGTDLLHLLLPIQSWPSWTLQTLSVLKTLRAVRE